MKSERVKILVYVAFNVACWMQKNPRVEISLEKCNAFQTLEFSSEILVL